MIVENKLTSAAKLSLSSLSHWTDPKQCVHHQLVEEMDIFKCNPLLPSPTISLSLIL